MFMKYQEETHKLIMRKNSNNFKKIPIQQKKSALKHSKYDPWEKILVFVNILRWITITLKNQRIFLKRFVFPFSNNLFLNLFKNGFFIEAKFFFIITNLKFLNCFRFILKKKISINFSSFLDFKKSIRLTENKNIRFKIPRTLFQELHSFLEKKKNYFFLKNFKKKFLIKKKRNLHLLKKEKMYFQIKNLCNLNSFENFPTELTPKFNQAEGFKVLKLILQRSSLANCAFLSNKEKNLAVGLQNSIITVFDLTKKKNSNSNFFLGHRKSVFSIKVSPCNNFLLSGSLNGEIFLWSLEFKKKFEKFQNNLNPIWDLEFSKTGEFFLSSGKDSTISLWNPGRTFPLRIFNGHRSDVNKISWHPIQNFFATGSDDNTVGLWDLRTARKIGNIKTFNQPVKSLTFSPEGNELSFAGFSRFIDTWDIKADRFSRRIKESFDIKIIKNLTYSKNGKFFGYVGNHSIVKIWTKARKQEKSLRDKSFKNWDFKKSVEGQTERILDFNFSERCRGIIVGSN